MATIGAVTAAFPARSAAPPQQDPFRITRANLANSAAFTVTQTLTPKGGERFERIYKIQIKGKKARIDFTDPSAGSVRYVANEKGLYLYIPANKTAMKQSFKGGVEEALQLAFQQVKDQMAGAKKAGAATISGQPTTVYKTPSGLTVYWGTRPGFRLPLKTVQSNVGGTTIVVVTDLKLNPTLGDAAFALPAGTQFIDSGSGGSAPSLPGLPGA